MVSFVLGCMKMRICPTGRLFCFYVQYVGLNKHARFEHTLISIVMVNENSIQDFKMRLVDLDIQSL